jgi:hypothetical protein
MPADPIRESTRAERVRRLWETHRHQAPPVLSKGLSFRVHDQLPEERALPPWDAPRAPDVPDLQVVEFCVRHLQRDGRRWPVVVADNDIIVEHLR